MTYTSQLMGLIPSNALQFPLNEEALGILKTPDSSAELRRFSTSFEPLDFQLELIELLGDLLSESSVTGLLCLATGAGKTYTASNIVLNHLLKLNTQLGNGVSAIWM